MAADWIPETRFAQARGARLAYQKFGEGEHRILAIPPLAQNIEIAWEWPDVRAMLERFGSFSEYVVFDKRGTGASDRHSQVPGLDERVEDIRAIMDAVGWHSAHFFVQSDGGAMAIMFAVTYPVRVESLVLNGSYARLMHQMTDAELADSRDQFVAEWGTPQSRVVDRFAPSRAADQEYRTWHQRYERHAAGPGSLRDLIDLTREIDVVEVLGDVAAPTMVQHRTGEQIVPIELGRELADGIPGAVLVEYDSPDHYAYIGDLDPWMSDVERFVTGTTRPRPATPPTPLQVRINTLGRFTVEIDDDEVPTADWGSSKARQLCKRLVAARGWPTTRDELIDMLWPDEHDRRKLSARLSVQLSAVRRILRGGVIADRATVRLDLEEVSTDLEDFYKATDDAAIVGAYPGDFLPEDLYEDWTGAPRDEARSRFVAAARRMADGAMGVGDHDAAATLARRLVSADRYDESAHEAWQLAMAELDATAPAFDDVVES
jgi:pimeloyl-ACP methyl ester carboxylesterase/DNA-binding SARP family transcriptional activator